MPEQPPLPSSGSIDRNKIKFEEQLLKAANYDLTQLYEFLKIMQQRKEVAREILRSKRREDDSYVALFKGWNEHVLKILGI